MVLILHHQTAGDAKNINMMMMMQTQLKQVLYCPEMICRGQHNLRFDQQIVKDIFWLSVYGRCDNGVALEL